MATVTERPLDGAWNETDRRVRHPLQAVRGYIRTYVILEGLGNAILYLALWFWIGLFIDWGIFKLFAFDWVQELQYFTSEQGADFWLRLVLLGILLLGLVAVVVSKMVLRLMREFTDPAVALLLERRFPRELGDRLITAVEMADPNLAQKYGYSAALMDKTIHEAADRVEKLPVTEVFNWARLRNIFLFCGLLTLGLYVLVGIGTCAIGAAMGRSSSPLDFMWRFNDAAFIWTERNVLLMDTYWPRQAYLEVIGFQDTPAHPNEMRVGRDEQRPDLQVRALRWVVADRRVQGGWRPLRWHDLDKFFEPELLAKVDMPVSWPGWIIDLDDFDAHAPSGILPAAWQGKTSGEISKEMAQPSLQGILQTAKLEPAAAELLNWQTWTMDRLAIQMEKAQVRSVLRAEHVDAVAALENIFSRLEELVQSPSLSRRLRQLEIPTQVTVYYRGKSIKNEQSYELLPDNKYTIGLNDLKESVRFTVCGLDYYTPYKDITLVPPPSLTSLVADKAEPAYIYHRLQGDQKPLKEKKQIFQGHPISLTGETSILQVPLGTDLVLHAEVEKGRKLKEGVRVTTPDKFSETGALVPDGKVVLDPSGQKFSLRIDHVVKTYEFYFDFLDQDNVKGRRRLLIRPIDDRPPELFDVELEVVLRKPRFKQEPGKTGQSAPIDGYLITPDALLPIKGTIQDDYGLTLSQWVYEVEQVEIELMGDTGAGKTKVPTLLQGNPRTRRVGLIASGLQFTPGQPGLALTAPGYWSWLARMLLVDLALKRPEGEQTAPLDTFLRRQEERAGDEIPASALEARLKEKPSSREPFRKISWKDSDGFDIKRFLGKLKASDPQNQPQLHYLLKLALSATDNNVETGPGTSRNKVPFTFLIISETELLAQVGMEEEVLSERLEKVYEKLKNAKINLNEQFGKLSQTDPKYDAISIRVDEVRKAIMDGTTATREIFTDYARIQRELEVNRVNLDKVLNVANKIVTPLGQLLDAKDGDFSQAEEMVQKLFESLEDDVVAMAKSSPNLEQTRPSRAEATRLARDKVDLLMTKLNDILVVMQQEVTYAKALERVLFLERVQRQTAERLHRLHLQRERELIEELLNPPSSNKK